MLAAFGSKIFRHEFADQVMSGIFDVLPRVAQPDTWLTAVRVLLAFIIPLFFGAIVDTFDSMFAVALASGMVALADPRGSVQRRSVSMITAIFGGAVAIYVGELIASSLGFTLLLLCLAGFCFGLMCEFGTAALRSSFLITSCLLMGAGSGLNGPTLHSLDILSGGTLPLILALAVFPRGFWQRKHFTTRMKDFGHNIKGHILMRTPIGRHAYRIMSAVGISIALSALFDDLQSTWCTMACLALFYPTSPLLYKRGARYIIATLIAVGVSLILMTFLDNIYLHALLVAIGLFFAAAGRSANYAFFSFTNALFYILVTMLVTGVGGSDLLFARVRGVVVGIVVSLIIATFTLPAKERLALLASMGLPLPLNEHIDDPVLARIRLNQVLGKMKGKYETHFPIE